MNHLLPDGYVQIDSKVDGVTVYEPDPLTSFVNTKIRFECPQCAGTTAHRAADGGLTCPVCGYHDILLDKSGKDSAETFDLNPNDVQQSAQGWGTARKEVECRSCNGRLVASIAELSAVCTFCGSSDVVHHNAHQEVIRPGFLIPFAFNEQRATEKLKGWLNQGGWLTPTALRKATDVDSLTPVYLPYWAFDATVVATWSANVGKVATNNVGGRTQSTTVWQQQGGDLNKKYTNVQVNGSEHITSEHFGRIQDYNLSAMVPYEPKYLTGTRAQAYEVPLEKAWSKARHQLRDMAKKQSLSSLDAVNVQNFSMDLDFQDEAWRYLLVPVYIANYTHNNQTHQVLINGQTGTIAGSQTVNRKNIFLAALLPMLAGSAVMLFQWLIGVSDSNWPPALAGLLFAAGTLLAALLSYRAMEMLNE